MDDTDQQLIALLRANARAPVATLARQLKVARGTVQNRLAKLEAAGTIAGYTVRLKPQAEAHRIRALTTIAVDGNRGEAVLRPTREALDRMWRADAQGEAAEGDAEPALAALTTTTLWEQNADEERPLPDEDIPTVERVLRTARRAMGSSPA